MVWGCYGSRVRYQLGPGRRLGKDEKDSKDARDCYDVLGIIVGTVFGYVSVKVGVQGVALCPSLCARKHYTLSSPLSENK